MSCPAATLTVWASAWLNQRAASDDVLDALQFWAETHDMVAADRQASLDLGLPLDGEYPSPPIQLLAGLRAQGARRAFLVLPVAGDVRGLGGPGPFSTQALRRGEGMVLGDLDIGMVPHSPADGVLRWTAYTLPGNAGHGRMDIREAERVLSDTVRSSTSTLSALEVAGHRHDTDEAFRDQLHGKPGPPWPEGMPGRALRVLQRTDEVEAIVSLAGEGKPGAVRSAHAAQRSEDALRDLTAALRTARCAAVSEAARAFSGCADQYR